MLHLSREITNDERPLQEALDAAGMLPASKAAASSDSDVQFKDDKTAMRMTNRETRRRTS